VISPKSPHPLAAFADNLSCRSICMPTRQQFRPNQASSRTRRYGKPHAGHFFRKCGRQEGNNGEGSIIRRFPE
jgi:hypothetical protein